MRITYDPEADAMNIQFIEDEYDVSKEVADGIIVDYNKKGKVMSIEILDVSRRVPKEKIMDIIVENPLRAVEA